MSNQISILLLCCLYWNFAQIRIINLVRWYDLSIRCRKAIDVHQIKLIFSYTVCFYMILAINKYLKSLSPPFGVQTMLMGTHTSKFPFSNSL